jgi:hypothetical protein
MLEIAAKLPPGALVGAEDRLLSQALARSGGARFLAREADLIRTDGKITGWREARGAVEATAAAPNTGNSRFDPGPPGAMLCNDGVNCGFALIGFTPEVKAFTVAVIYSSGGEARTLASVFTGQSHNMIFLSESEGRILAKDRQTTIEVSLPRPAGADQFVILSFDGNALRLQAGGQLTEAKGRVPAMAHPGDFFIGCRSNRSGLAKTLGTSRMHEVLFWPERALLGSADADDMAALEALDRYQRWTL